MLTCSQWNFCPKKAKLNIQMTIVLTLSKTILVVADSSFVTLIPAKLKKAIEIIVPNNTEVNKIKLTITFENYLLTIKHLNLADISSKNNIQHDVTTHTCKCRLEKICTK